MKNRNECIAKHQDFLTTQLQAMQSEMDDLATGGQDVVVSITEATTQDFEAPAPSSTPELPNDQLYNSYAVQGSFNYNPSINSPKTQEEIYADLAELKAITNRLGIEIDVAEIKVQSCAPVQKINFG